MAQVPVVLVNRLLASAEYYCEQAALDILRLSLVRQSNTTLCNRTRSCDVSRKSAPPRPARAPSSPRSFVAAHPHQSGAEALPEPRTYVIRHTLLYTSYTALRPC